jgi:hypothetical protein
MDDDAIRGLTVIKDGAITWPAPAPTAPACAAKVQQKIRPRRKSQAHGAGEPMSAVALTVMFAVAAVLFWSSARTHRRPSRALHRVRAGLLRRLHGGVERHARAALRR